MVKKNATHGTDHRVAVDGTPRQLQQQEKFTATAARWNGNVKTSSDDAPASVRSAVGGAFQRRQQHQKSTAAASRLERWRQNRQQYKQNRWRDKHQLPDAVSRLDLDSMSTGSRMDFDQFLTGFNQLPSRFDHSPTRLPNKRAHNNNSSCRKTV